MTTTIMTSTLVSSNEPPTAKTRIEKGEGSIGNSFASLTGERAPSLPAKYAVLKREIIGDVKNQAGLVAAWSRLTSRLAEIADKIENEQSALIPEVTYEELVGSPSAELVNKVKRCGTVVVHGTISTDQAKKWLDSIREYVEINPQVKGFPENDKQVYEIYWCKAQQEARSHPRMLKTQEALLSLFTTQPELEVSLGTPLLYADRLRIRRPGDTTFALGPHMDGGSIERWEDVDYRSVFDKILTGKWEEFDAWEMEKRAVAKHDLYPGPGSTGLFRAWQGWTSLSSTGPTEGTLLVYPYIREHCAYVLMRPLFKYKQPRSNFSENKAFLSARNWELDFNSTEFPGSPPYRNQELNEDTHPHLELHRTMVPIPKVSPGGSVWWHSDVIHAVEPEHCGTHPAAVMYIPAVALTTRNAEYIRDQREAFLSGRPPPDFPGGTGESKFLERGTAEDLLTASGKRGMGLEPFIYDAEMSESERAVRMIANKIFGF